MGRVGNDGDQGAGPVVGAVDIGSNTIKLTVGRPGGRRPVELLRASETVRLGLGVARTGRLDEDRVEHAAAVLRRFADAAAAEGATRLVGVATEATRAAANGPDFLDRVRRETGLEIASISGAEEANLVFRGLAAMVDLQGRVVAADIGGGSTEVLSIEHGDLLASRSLRLGSGTLTERHVASDPPKKDEIAACVAAAAEALAALELPAGSETRLIVVGGTARYCARLAGTDGAMAAEAVDDVLVLLRKSPARRVARTLGITRARALVLPAGVAVIRALADRTAAARVEAAASTMRVGLLLATFEELGEKSVATAGSAAADSGVPGAAEARSGARPQPPAVDRPRASPVEEGT